MFFRIVSHPSVMSSMYTRSLGSAVHIYYMILYAFLFVFFFPLESQRLPLTCSLYPIFDINNDDSSQYFYAGYYLWQISSILPASVSLYHKA